jgi:hypothetical protein
MTLPSDIEPEEKEKRDELIFQLIKGMYDFQLQRMNSLDSKAGNLVGFVSIIVGLLIGLAGFELLNKLTEPGYYWIYFAGIVLLLASIVFSLVALKLRKLEFFPNVKSLSLYSSVSYRYFMKVNGNTLVDVIDKMDSANETKAQWIEASWYALLAGLILVFAFLAFIALTGGVKPEVD